MDSSSEGNLCLLRSVILAIIARHPRSEWEGVAGFPNDNWREGLGILTALAIEAINGGASGRGMPSSFFEPVSTAVVPHGTPISYFTDA